MVHKIILIRHGQSEFNDQNLFCGWRDVNLTAKGIQQAKSASQLLKQANIRPELIFTSRLKRSIQTGDIIKRTLGLEDVECVRSWRLNERHYGQLQGHSKSEVLAKVGKEQYMYWRRDINGIPPLETEVSEEIKEKYKDEFPDGTGIPRGESLKMVIERLKELLFGEIQRNVMAGKTVLVVAHGSTVRATLVLLKKITDEEEIKSLNIPNSMPLVIELDDNFNFLNEYYLDPANAALESKRVANEGFGKL
jgi:2,3-bisphosphoglycerate-dependent phosphoglycerate mutase